MFRQRHFIAAAACALILAVPARAADVNVVGLFPNKALLEINKQQARIVNVGQSVEGIKLIATTADGVTVEIEGKRHLLALGQSTAIKKNDDKASVVLTADTRGHFLASGTINGASTRFLVDTGASQIAMSTAEAKRLGVSYLSGKKGTSQTANGMVSIYIVQLDNVKVGDISMNQVEAAVIEGNGMHVTLLGMSFLKRVDMRRQGSTLTLTKSY
jgi:aspartyl protease family protein